MKLTDLYLKEEWDKILGMYKTLMGIAPITFDDTGTLISTPVFTCDACRIIKSSPEGAKRCSDGHRKMVEKAKTTKDTVIEECHAGFTKVVIPIFNDDEFLGVTGGCNIFRENHYIDFNFYLNLASELAVDSSLLLEGVKKAKVVPDRIIAQQNQILQMKISARLKLENFKKRRIEIQKNLDDNLKKLLESMRS